MSDEPINLAHYHGVPTTLGLAKIDTINAILPEVYKTACAAIVECEQIDECKDWADKAAALVSYAKQAKDKTLQNHAQRIQLRALRRVGELLAEIEPSKGGRPKATDGTVSSLSDRQQAAQDAGLSERQHATALRIAHVPEQQFEEQVESSPAPTVTAVADIGTDHARAEQRAETPTASDKAARERRAAEAEDAVDEFGGAVDRLHKAFLKLRKIARGDAFFQLGPASRTAVAKRCNTYIVLLLEIRDALDPEAKAPSALRGHGTYAELSAKRAAAHAKYEPARRAPRRKNPRPGYGLPPE